MKITDLIIDFPVGNGFTRGLDGPRTFNTKVVTGTLGWWVRATPLNRISLVEPRGLDLDENLAVFSDGSKNFFQSGP